MNSKKTIEERVCEGSSKRVGTKNSFNKKITKAKLNVQTNMTEREREERERRKGKRNAKN